MSRAWALKHGAAKPQDFKNAEDTFASRNANGTGPFRFVVVGAGGEDDPQEEPRLVGHRGRALRGQRGRDRLPAHQVGRHAHGRARLRRDRFRARPAAAGRRAAEVQPAGEDRRGAGEPRHLPRHGADARRAQVLEREGEEPAAGPARAPGALRGHRRRGHPLAGDARPVGADRLDGAGEGREPRLDGAAAAALRPGALAKSCWPRPATRTGSTRSSCAPTTAT